MPYNEDRGLTIIVNTGINLSGYSALKIKYKTPSATPGEWAATIYDEAAGKIYYKSSLAANELTTGNWTIQPKITFGTGEVYHGAQGSFAITAVMIPTP